MAPGARQRAAVALPALRRARLRLEAGVLQMLEGAPGDHELTSSTMMTSSPVVVRGPVALPIDGAPLPSLPCTHRFSSASNTGTAVVLVSRMHAIAPIGIVGVGRRGGEGVWNMLSWWKAPGTSRLIASG